MDLGNVTKYFYGHHGTVEACSSVYRPNIKVNKLHDDAHLPTYGSANAACADLYAYIGFDDATMVNKNGDRCIMIQPHETVKVHTGLRMAPPEGWYIQGFARSGLSTKQGLAPVNAVPIIDQDYRGEIIIPLHNYSNIPQMITHGDRIAQMAVVPFWQANFEEVSELDETERGAGGFGSTGKQ
jgi:dUTP pyrophosphatase